jgi:hypothetical protein
MPKKIYNKNAREKALLEEAYSSVYNEQLNQEVMVGAEVMWDGQRKRGQVEEVDLENGVAVVYDEDGGEHIVELDNFDVVLNPEGEEDTDVADQAEFAKIDPLENEKARRQGFNPRENEEGELSDDWMKQDHESRQEERGGNHAKGVKMALEALEMFKDELHVDGHPEDININELADAHDQLSRALHWLLDETDVEYITGGRATRVAETQLDYKPTYGEY